MHNKKTYAVINLTDVGLIDFAQINETSSNTIRKSIDETQFVIKWEEGHIPSFISNSSVVPVAEYDHHAILQLMQSSEWSETIEE